MKRFALLLISVSAYAAAPAFVQINQGNSVTQITSQSATLTTTPTVGNIVVVAVSLGNVDTIVTGVTDNQGNAYVMLGQQTNPAANVVQGSLWCTQVGTASGTFTATATTNLVTFSTVYIAEYSGASCLMDKVGSAFGNTSPYSCGSFTTRQATALILSTLDTSSGNASLTITPPTGFTLRAQTTNGLLFQAGGLADNIVASTGTFTPVWTVSASAGAACVTAAIYPASGGGGGGTAFSFGVPQ